MQNEDCRLQIRGKMRLRVKCRLQTMGKIQNGDRRIQTRGKMREKTAGKTSARS